MTRPETSGGSGGGWETPAAATAAAEHAARESRGRLLAYLARRFRDIAAAEDALGEAFLAALRAWPREGVPANPDAWLLTAARRRMLDVARHARVRDAALPDLVALTALAVGPARTPAGPAEDTMDFPDERLSLMLLCAHPAIHPAVRAPLMLQTILGLDAARIAAVYLVESAAMGQRLTRAKTKIRDAGMRFEKPGLAELPERLDAVLEAIYAAYGSGWDDPVGSDPRRAGLAEEALWLGRIVAESAPDQPEALGLLALMLHCEARRGARRAADGGMIVLADQDTRVWNHTLMAQAERLLGTAAAARRPGRYQLEAAIQSAHAARAFTGRVDWTVVVDLYDRLVEVAPSAGAKVARAAALIQAGSPDQALAALDAMDPSIVNTYQPYHVTRARILRKLGRDAESALAMARALELTADPAVRRFLETSGP